MSDSLATVLAYIISMTLMFSYVASIAIRRHRIQKEAANYTSPAPVVKNAGPVGTKP